MYWFPVGANLSRYLTELSRLHETVLLASRWYDTACSTTALRAARLYTQCNCVVILFCVRVRVCGGEKERGLEGRYEP